VGHVAIDPALAWRVVSLLALGWLAFFFGRTLRPGREPLITRIARVSDPALAPALQRYTRRLTALWCGWFLLAALLSLAFGRSPWAGLLVGAGSAILFIAEHRLRPWLLPGQPFPGLRQQLRDTLHAWRARPQDP
jgi:uncharacterized membrane protein